MAKNEQKKKQRENDRDLSVWKKIKKVGGNLEAWINGGKVGLSVP